MQVVSGGFRSRSAQGFRTDRTATRRFGNLKVSFVSLESLVKVLAASAQ